MRTVFPSKHSDLDAPDFLDLFRSVIRNGVVDGCEITVGSSGWLIDINSGKVLIDGTYVFEDLVKVDHTDLGHTSGLDGHYAVYQTYAYADSDPAASSGFLVSVAAPPLQPVVPGGAVKLADIFVPATATSLASSGVRIVNAPKLPSRIDANEIPERMIASVANTLSFSTGAVNYDDDAGTLVISQEVIIQSTVSSHRQEFEQAPALVRGRIPAGTYAIPGTPGSRDVVLYCLYDRSVPNENQPLTLKALDRNNPNSAMVDELLNPGNFGKVYIVGIVFGSQISLAGLTGALPPPVANPKFILKNDPAGQHSWAQIVSAMVAGGLRTSVADLTARDAIAAGEREQGMVAYVVAEGMYYALIGGIDNVNWSISNEENFNKGGVHIVANNAALLATPAKLLRVGMLAVQVDNGALMKLTAITPSVAWTTLMFLIGGTEGEIGVGVIRPGNETTGGLTKKEIKALPYLFRDQGANSTRTRVITGMGLVPFFSSGTAQARLKPGACVDRPGNQTVTTADLTLNLGIAASYIGATPTLPTGFPRNIYLFVRKDGVLRASASAPASAGGAPTADAGFSSTEYVYVGLLRPKAVSGADHEECWGSFMVVNDGTGARHIYFDLDDAELTAGTAIAHPVGNPAFIYDINSVNPFTLVPTAAEVDYLSLFSVDRGGVSGVTMRCLLRTFYGSRVEYFDDEVGPVDYDQAITIQARAPLRNKITKLQVQLFTTSGSVAPGATRNISTSERILGMHENVNTPFPDRQMTYGDF